MKAGRKPRETAASSKNKKAASPQLEIDMNKFRLRSFVERLIELGEVEIHELCR
jgi:hypothetical protein